MPSDKASDNVCKSTPSRTSEQPALDTTYGTVAAALTVNRFVVTDDHGEDTSVTALPGVVTLPLSFPSLLLSR